MEIDVHIKQFNPENELGRSDTDASGAGQHSFSHTLLDINRTLMVNQTSKYDIAYKLFNYSVFKLACILERVRRYKYDIVQPRDQNLEVIEVNLDTEAKYMLADTRMINIWQKNDFIMCYQVL